MLCKIWNFILNLFTDTLNAIAVALKTVGEVFCDVLTSVGTGVGNLIGGVFGGSNFIVWAGVGVLAYFLLTKQDDKDKDSSALGSWSRQQGVITNA